MLQLLCFWLFRSLGVEKNWGVQSGLKIVNNGYAQYGNFCAPEYPDTGAPTPDEDLRALSVI